ncbi:MAG: rRNA pseudouridine synthase [Desulfobacteraceae bacterium]|nr:rRNA pseudouridine synthase [Desulfobacteraceae bacterium]MBC2754389.1 rRNA pseudouridine synthase [Desulfobacteraceae bacterium]
MIRLQKYLSGAGICSRRKGEEYIKSGRIKVNGEVVTQLGVQVDPEKDQVEVDGNIVRDNQQLIYIMLNKPQGYITSRSHRGKKIVFDLVNVQQRLNPVGRLDKDSTGLLLLTNDGRLHQRLTHPSFDHEKEYEVEVLKPIDDKALFQFEKGLLLDGVKTRPASVGRINGRKFRIILKEGRKRQIRRMVEMAGNQVVNLHRIRISNLRLRNLKMGRWRYLTEKEIKALLKSCNITADTFQEKSKSIF